MKEFIQYYLILSIVMAVIITVFKFVKNKPLSQKIDMDEFFREDIESGHIEKEVFGNRTVYYEKDLFGKASVKACDDVEWLKKEHIFLYLILATLVSFINQIIVWPKTLSDMFTNKGKK